MASRPGACLSSPHARVLWRELPCPRRLQGARSPPGRDVLVAVGRERRWSTCAYMAAHASGEGPSRRRPAPAGQGVLRRQDRVTSTVALPLPLSGASWPWGQLAWGPGMRSIMRMGPGCRCRVGSPRVRGLASPLAASLSLPPSFPPAAPRSGSPAALRQKVSSHLFLKRLRRSPARRAAAAASFPPAPRPDAADNCCAGVPTPQGPGQAGGRSRRSVPTGWVFLPPPASPALLRSRRAKPAEEEEEEA